MRIGIIGVGNIGGLLAHRFVEAGHEVAVSNSRGTETLGELVRDIGPGALAVAPQEAVEFSDVIVVSVPFNRYRELPADGAAGKVVIDTNNYWPPRDGKIDEVESSGSTDGELLQEHMKGARVVKAFNAIGAQSLRDLGKLRGSVGRIALPICGDDEAAKAVTSELVDEVGFDTVDAGMLAAGRKFQLGMETSCKDLEAAELRARLAAVR